MLQFTYCLDEIEEAAKKIIDFAADSKVWLFKGEMGAGKTTLITNLAKILGVADKPSSPTFSIINEYALTKPHHGYEKICHMDLYRLNGVEDAINAGVEDSLQAPMALAWIEWPENASELLPKSALEIAIETLNPEVRSISVKFGS